MKKLALTAAALFLALGAFAGDGGKKGDKKSAGACCQDPNCVVKCKESGTDCKKETKSCCKMQDVKKETK